MTEKLNVLITDDCHEVLPQGLARTGFNVDYMPGISLTEIDQEIGRYDGIIINTRVKMDQARIDRGERLKFIGRIGSGLDIIDLNYAHSKKIKIVSSPEGNAPAVGEHALSMLLSLLNKLPQCAEEVKKGRWDRESVRGRALSGLTIGVIGYGHTGPAFVRVLSGFEVVIKIFDKYKKIKNFKNGFATMQEATLEDIQATCDVISLHIPLSDETANLIDESFVSKVKSGCILINTSRGKIVNLEAVREGLIEGKLGGCCLDVFPNEVPETYSEKDAEVFNFFTNSKRAILSPHVAGWTKESKHMLALVLLEKLLSIYNSFK